VAVCFWSKKAMNRNSTRRLALFVVGIGTLTAALAGCSGDDAGSAAGTGGAGGTAGGGAGGKATGGSGSGGKGTGGLPGTGGKGSGGQGTGGAPIEVATDGGCVLPHYVVYRSPGCGARVIPECIAPPTGNVDGGLSEACACDGTRILGGNGFTKPYRYLGECTDASVLDSGSDSGKDAH
jgi:hypothetical protein